MQRHTSPDGVLTFIVRRDSDDVMLGFEGFGWHTHADILAALYDMPQSLAVDHFVRDLLSDRSVIAVSCIDEKLQDVWITDDPVRELRHAPQNEVIELRHWGGRAWKSV